MDVGVEVFSLSKAYNMTGWRCAAIVGNAEAIARYWRLKTNVDSGLFEAVQLAGAEALTGPQDSRRARCARIYQRRRDLVIGALREIGIDDRAAEGDDLRLGAGAGGPHLGVVRRGGARARRRVVVSPGSAYGPNGEGFFRISLTVPDDRLDRGGRADAREPHRPEHGLQRVGSRSRLSVEWSGPNATIARRQSRYGPADGAGIVNPRARQRALCIAVLPLAPRADGRDELAELKELLRTARRRGRGRAGPAPRRSRTRTPTSARASSRS